MSWLSRAIVAGWLCVAAVAGLPLVGAEPLDAVLVQFAVHPADFASIERFRARVDATTSRAVDHYGADLVVFPEYTTAIAAFSTFITAAGPEIPADLPGHVLRSALEAGRGEVPPASAMEPFHNLVADSARDTAVRLRSLWAAVARRYEVWIIAGTALVPGDAGGVRNRAWVFAPDGTLAYRQDKVFLTEYEQVVLGLDPGTVTRARAFRINGVDLGLTICRDSYFDVWERRFGQVDAWIDIRANGEPWSQSVRRRFDTALPERVAETAVPQGVSASLTGRLFGLLWQGPAFVVDPAGNRVRQAPHPDGNYLLPVTLGESAGE